MSLRTSSLIGAMLVVLSHSGGFAQGCNPQAFPHPLLEPGISFDTQFGAAVAVRGNYALVGAPESGSGGGKVYLYELIDGDWVNTNTFTPPAGSASDRFGSAVALDGTRAFIGAPGANGKTTGDGAVFVYNRTTLLGNTVWVLESKLFGGAGVALDEFGGALAADDGILVVGVSGHDVPGEANSGRADVFERISGFWNKTATLAPVSPLQSESFGSAVAIDGNHVVIGCEKHGGPLPYPVWNGRAFIFERQANGSWSVDAQLNPADSIEFRRFGSSVAIVGTRVLVGAPGAKDAIQSFQGAGYVFEKPFGAANWVQTAKLANDDNDYYGEFGLSVALSLNQAWIAGAKQIRRFAFEANGWVSAAAPVPPFNEFQSGTAQNDLGSVLAADGPMVFVGQPSVSYLEEEHVLPFHTCGGVWTVVGKGTFGSAGVPELRGAGSLQDGLALEFRLQDGKPSAPALFMLHGGAAPAGAKFAGGLLYTLPIHFSIVVPLTANGGLVLPAVLAPGFASAKFTAQVLISDPVTVSDLVLSNALEFQIGL